MFDFVKHRCDIGRREGVAAHAVVLLGATANPG